MTTVCLSPIKDRLCVAWTAQVIYEYGCTAVSDAFSFQDIKYRLEFVFKESNKSQLRLILIEGPVIEPFVTVLVEKPGSIEPVCQILACERVSKLPWECTFFYWDIQKYASSLINSGSSFNSIRFVLIFEEDPTSVRNDIQRPIQTECTQRTSKDFPSNLENLSLDFANLLKNETLPDVKLKCGGRDRAIPAHRAVLAARSEVFAAMFCNEMVESQSGVVDIIDVDDDVIDLFLQYVYSGKIPSGVPDEVVPGLYAVADKYAVHALRETCRDRMVRALTEENCVDFLTVADAHCDVDFKKLVIQFICSHDAVLEGDAWREFEKEPSPLVVEVYHKLFEKAQLKYGKIPAAVATRKSRKKKSSP